MATATTPRRMTVKRLRKYGFVQGKTEERNDGNCETCGKRIQTVRSWWIGGGGEYDDNWQGYCRKHAEERVLKDEADLAIESPDW